MAREGDALLAHSPGIGDCRLRSEQLSSEPEASATDVGGDDAMESDSASEKDPDVEEADDDSAVK